MLYACAVVGAFAGAELLYNSDKDVHNAVFVDHLNTMAMVQVIQIGTILKLQFWYNSYIKIILSQGR